VFSRESFPVRNLFECLVLTVVWGTGGRGAGLVNDGVDSGTDFLPVSACVLQCSHPAVCHPECPGYQEIV
jgi:hypothetical protein